MLIILSYEETYLYKITEVSTGFAFTLIGAEWSYYGVEYHFHAALTILLQADQDKLKDIMEIQQASPINQMVDLKAARSMRYKKT